MSATSTAAAVVMAFNTSGDLPPKPQPPAPTDRSVILARVPKVSRPGPRSLKDRRNAGEHPPLPWENI